MYLSHYDMQRQLPSLLMLSVSIASCGYVWSEAWSDLITMGRCTLSALKLAALGTLKCSSSHKSSSLWYFALFHPSKLQTVSLLLFLCRSKTKNYFTVWNFPGIEIHRIVLIEMVNQSGRQISAHVGGKYLFYCILQGKEINLTATGSHVKCCLLFMLNLKSHSHIITELQGLEGTSRAHQVQTPANAGTQQ